jgi:PAS domain S-box-containing protein
VLSIVVLLLMLLLIAQGGFNLTPVLAPDTTGETLLLYALSTLNFLAFITLLFVLLRNVLKLVRERRAGRVGSKFKARLVSYAIGLTLLPVLLLFFFAFGLLNRSIDRWFGEPARQIVDEAREIEESYFRREETGLVNVARSVARALSLSSSRPLDLAELDREIAKEMADHNLALIRVIGPGVRITSGPEGDVAETLGQVESQLVSGAETHSGRAENAADAQVIYVAAGVRVNSPEGPRLLILASEVPPDLTQRLARIDQQHRNFHYFLVSLRRIKAIYILLLGAVALLLIFAASWLALHLARGITVPIQALAEATDRIARGDFSRPVQEMAEDELATLVRSFNQMAGQLSENRQSLEQAAEVLRRTNLALEDRRRYIETVLESLSTGVISTDEKAGVATINRAALFMLGLRDKPASGTPVSLAVGGPEGEELQKLCRRARRTDIAQADIEFRRPDGSTIHAATTAVALRNSEGVVEGWVIVIEDLTDLIQAERAAAWSEVARRMAHEIKNPLTPIQLSAERIIRHYQRRDGVSEDRFDKAVREGSATIIREVATLQRMVEEFSRFARLPEAKPVELQLNDVVRDAAGLYAGRLNGIRLECKLAEDLPALLLDPDQMKRVLVNLIDNAVEALNEQGSNGSSAKIEKLITIESKYVRASEVARLIVTDTGHGIRPADRDKLFLPKFSTRDRGTGLGLAIVSHIIADHNGRIWVEENQPQGARFIIELPTRG